jgi:hypothetical protein
LPRNRGISWPSALFLFRLNRTLKANSVEILRGSEDRRTIERISRLIPGPKFTLRPSDVPWARVQADYVTVRFGFSWQPVGSYASDYLVADFMSGMSKKDASLVREALAPNLGGVESAILRAQISAVLQNLEKDT